jgi:pyruvate formate lyase activating enzyme
MLCRGPIYAFRRIYMQGIVTDIQRFSLHDGPGIRTTIFLKGCNMRCAWCHNPETISAKPELILYPEKCIGCGKCVEVCTNQARRIIDGSIIFDRSLCVVCGRCADVCFSGAITISGRIMTAEEIMDEVIQDKSYYEHSGGGITVSGGEAFCQAEFLASILTTAKALGISTAVETNMNYDWKLMEEMLPLLDLIMFDIKLVDEQLHKKWTGVSNRKILQNVERLIELDKPIIARTPIIPGVNDNQETICQIANLLKGAKGLMYYELLNFNPLGESKYNGLGLSNAFKGVRPLKEERIEALAREVREIGLAVRIG